MSDAQHEPRVPDGPCLPYGRARRMHFLLGCTFYLRLGPLHGTGNPQVAEPDNRATLLPLETTRRSVNRSTRVAKYLLALRHARR